MESDDYAFWLACLVVVIMTVGVYLPVHLPQRYWHYDRHLACDAATCVRTKGDINPPGDTPNGQGPQACSKDQKACP